MIGELWILGSIIFINLILSADNSLVISLAANRLSKDLRKRAIVWGSITAVGLRIVLLAVGAYFIQIPFCKIIASVLLLWVAIQLVIDHLWRENHKSYPTNEQEPVDGQQKTTIIQAIRTIAVADFVMSLDNAIAMLGTANGHFVLMVIGLVITIPLLVFGSTFLSKLLETSPWIRLLAVTVLGWTAGDMVMDDAIFENLSYPDMLSWVVPVLTSIGILVFGLCGVRRQHLSPTSTHKAA